MLPPHSPALSPSPSRSLAVSPDSLGWVPACTEEPVCSVITGLNTVIATNYHSEAINKWQEDMRVLSSPGHHALR